MSLVIPANFQHILRVLNTNIDGKRNIMFAMTAIKGIGRRYANIVLKKVRNQIMTAFMIKKGRSFVTQNDGHYRFVNPQMPAMEHLQTSKKSINYPFPSWHSLFLCRKPSCYRDEKANKN